MSSVPDVMRALVTQGPGRVAAVQEIAVPKVQDNKILVKTKAAALNPTDWKHVKFVSGPGLINGCDFAGEVVQIGNNLNPKVSWKIGDRVSGFVHGSTYPGRGSFAEYVLADADICWKIPDNMSFEEASTMNMGPWTSVQALFHPKNLGLVEPPTKVPRDTWVFIYGGSTAVGHYAVQLAHLAGYKVVTVASPSNHDLVKSLGADAVFDYRDPDVIAKIKQVSGDSIHSALDTYSEKGSQELSVGVMAPGPGKVVVILGRSEAAAKMRADVAVIPTVIYSAFGVDWSYAGVFYAASRTDKDQLSNFILDKFPGLIKDIKPMKVRLFGGLDSINDGMEYMIDGKVSAEKIIFQF